MCVCVCVCMCVCIYIYIYIFIYHILSLDPLLDHNGNKYFQFPVLSMYF